MREVWCSGVLQFALIRVHSRSNSIVAITLAALTGHGYNGSMLETAIEAAAEAGKLLRKNFGTSLGVQQESLHDIKLEIDELSQWRITKVILALPAYLPYTEILQPPGSGRCPAVKLTASGSVIFRLDSPVRHRHHTFHWKVLTDGA